MSSQGSVWNTLNGLRRLISSREFQNHESGAFPKPSVVHSLVEHLGSSCEDVLHECLMLLSACIPHLSNETDSLLSEVLPQVATHLGNSNPQVKLGAINFFYAYSRHTDAIESFIEKFITCTVEHANDKIRHGAVLCVATFSKHFLEEKMFLHPFINVFASPSPQLLYTIFYALKRIHRIIGDEEFYSCLESGEKNASALYNDLLSGKHSSRMFPMGYSVLDGCLFQQESLDYEIKRYEMLYNIRSQIRSVGCSLIDLLPHVEYLVNFLGKLLSDSSLRIKILSLDILEIVIERIKCEIVIHLDIFIYSLLKSLECFERRIRKLGITLIHRIMCYVHPMAVIKQLLKHVHTKNCTVRSEIISRVTAGLFYYSCYSFDVNALCKAVSPFLEDTVLQVRQTCIECLVTIGHVLLMTGQPLDCFANYLKHSCHSKKSSINIIISHIRKGLLPSCTAEGNVLHAKYQHVDTDSTMDNISDDSCLTLPQANSELWSQSGRKSIFAVSEEFMDRKFQQYSEKYAGDQILAEKTEKTFGKNKLRRKSQQNRALPVAQKILANQDTSEDEADCYIHEQHDSNNMQNICNKGQCNYQPYERSKSKSTMQDSDAYFEKSANIQFSVTTAKLVKSNSTAMQVDFEKSEQENESNISMENISSSTPEPENHAISNKDLVELGEDIPPISAEIDQISTAIVSSSSASSTDTSMNKEEQHSFASHSSVSSESSVSQLSYVTSRDAKSHITVEDISNSDASPDGSGDAEEMFEHSYTLSSCANMQNCKLITGRAKTTENGQINIDVLHEIVDLPGVILDRLPPHHKNFNILLIDKCLKTSNNNIEEVSDSDDYSVPDARISYPSSETDFVHERKLADSRSCKMPQKGGKENFCTFKDFSNETSNALTLFKFPLSYEKTEELAANHDKRDSQMEQSDCFSESSGREDVCSTKTKPLPEGKSQDISNLFEELSVCPEKESNFPQNLEHVHDGECTVQTAVSGNCHIRKKTYVLEAGSENRCKKSKRHKRCESHMKKNICLQDHETGDYPDIKKGPVSDAAPKITVPRGVRKIVYKTHKWMSKLRSPRSKIGLPHKNCVTMGNSRQEKIPFYQYKFKNSVKIRHPKHQLLPNDAKNFMTWLKNFHFLQNNVSFKENCGKMKENMKKDMATRECFCSEAISTAAHVHHSPKARNKIQQIKSCSKNANRQKVNKDCNLPLHIDGKKKEIGHIQESPSLQTEHQMKNIQASKNTCDTSEPDCIQKSLNIKSKPNVKKSCSIDCIDMPCETKDGMIDVSEQNCSKLPPERRASDQWSTNIEFPRRSLNCPWADSFEQKIKAQTPFDGSDHATQVLKQVCDSMSESDILKKEECMLSIIRIAKFQPNLLGEYLLNKILLNLLTEMKNLRPSIAGQAVLTIGYLYMLIKKPLESKLRVVMAALLNKSGSRTFAGSYNAVIKSIFYMLKGLSTHKAAVALIQEGGRHPNKAVRETTAQFLSILTEKLGPVKCLMPSMCNLMLNAAAQFILDGSPLTRHCGKVMFSIFLKHKSFDSLKEKCLSDSVQLSILKILQSVSAKGVEKEILPINVIWTEEF